MQKNDSQNAPTWNVVWLLLYFDGFHNILSENEQEKDDWPDHYILEYLFIPRILHINPII